jgi:hypothetical protein
MTMRKWLLVGLAALLAVALVGTGLVVFAQGPTSTPAAGQDQSGPNDQSPAYTCSIRVPEDQANAASQARITADQAKAAALAANAGTTATGVSLDSENGCLVYSVELSNGVDVKVDAGNAQVLHSEAAGPEDSGHGQAEGSERGGED